jgi:hypothetical protein
MLTLNKLTAGLIARYSKVRNQFFYYMLTQKKLMLLLFIFSVMGCVQEPPGIPAGFSTNLDIGKDGRLYMTERQYAFFNNTLQGDPDVHFSGKLFRAFDTIYSSTLQRSIGNDPAAMLADDKSSVILAENETGYPSLFFQRNGWFIYRTFVPEPAHRQTVILDVAGKDSATIASYFHSNKMNQIIIR